MTEQAAQELGDFLGVPPTRTLLFHWAAVRKYPLGDGFIIRGFAYCLTRRGAERWAARWERREQELTTMEVRSGLRPHKPARVLVLDMREHPWRERIWQDSDPSS